MPTAQPGRASGPFLEGESCGAGGLWFQWCRQSCGPSGEGGPSRQGDPAWGVGLKEEASSCVWGADWRKRRNPGLRV